MANIKTYDLEVSFFDGSKKHHRNISITAVRYFREWYQETLYADAIIFVKHNGTK